MQASILYFDQFELDLNSYELKRSGRVVKLEKLPMELLILLIDHRGQLVTRDEIVQRLWGDDVFVDTRQGINTAVRKLRLALRDDPEHPRMVQTVIGRGYRLLAPVSSSVSEEPEAEIEKSPAIPLPPHIETPPPAISTRTRFGPRPFIPVGVIVVAGAFVVGYLSRQPKQKTKLPSEQRITANSAEAPIKFAVISPDGHYIAYTDPTGLYLRQIQTGETRRWPVPKDFVANPTSWFPDNTHLLVMRFEGPMRTPSLWVLSLLGANPRRLLDNAGPGWVSPDGSQIAFLALPGWGHELWLMKADGSDRRLVTSSSQPEPPASRESLIFPVTWSPDGRRLAYIERHAVPAPDPAEDSLFSLRTIDTTGQDLHVLLNDPRIGPAITWTADGEILFAYRSAPSSDRTDQGVRSIRLGSSVGEAPGQIKNVSDGAGRIGGMSTTADGKQVALWRTNSQVQTFIVRFDPATRTFASARRLTLDTNPSLAEAWLSDSRSALFVSNRNGTWTLYKQAVDDETPELLLRGQSIYLPRLSADGKDVLYESRAESNNHSVPVSLMRFPVAGGPSHQVLEDIGIVNYQCARLPSTLCILSELQGDDHVFVSFSPEHGIGREVLRIQGSFNNWSLSPDGTDLAVFPGDHRVRFFSVGNDLAREKDTVTLNDWRFENGDWSADGKGLLIPSVAPAGMPVILEVTKAGKASVVLSGATNSKFWALVPSPDGRFGILDVEVPADNNAWIIESL